MTRPSLIGIALAAVAACGGDRSGAAPRQAGAPAVAVVPEAFLTPFDTLDNVDSPAIYHHDSTHWVIATAKTADALIVYDAATGSVVKRVGETGTGVGQLKRPNGILVADDSLLFVVERDNGRVQGFRLPGFEPLGTFGEKLLKKPYGLAVVTRAPGVHDLYVTDNYETPDEQIPPDAQLGERIKQFRVRIAAGMLDAEHVRSFGDTAGEGVLRVVESIMADPAQKHLMIAEEQETDSYLKVYDLEGRFTGTVVGRGYFPQQAEGIALYTCGDSAGYWLATDQGDSTNTFHLFDRNTFEHVAAFTGEQTRRTDGVVLTQASYGPFRSGALYASHLDGGLGALDWGDVARTLGLKNQHCAR